MDPVHANQKDVKFSKYDFQSVKYCILLFVQFMTKILLENVHNEPHFY